MIGCQITCKFDIFFPVVVIHWTRQIKEVLTSQEAMESSDSSGPLEEIEFWRARCEDLSGLTTQLDQPGVIKVVSIIQKAKSSYLTPFQRLSQQIQVCVCVCVCVCVSAHVCVCVYACMCVSGDMRRGN